MVFRKWAYLMTFIPDLWKLSILLWGWIIICFIYHTSGIEDSQLKMLTIYAVCLGPLDLNISGLASELMSMIARLLFFVLMENGYAFHVNLNSTWLFSVEIVVVTVLWSQYLTLTFHHSYFSSPVSVNVVPNLVADLAVIVRHFITEILWMNAYVSLYHNCKTSYKSLMNKLIKNVNFWCYV